MSNVSKAAAVTPPVAGSNTWALAADDYSTASHIEIPNAWYGAILRFRAVGEDFVFSFGTDSLSSVDETAESTVTSNAFSAQGSVPYRLNDGEERDFDMSLLNKHKHTRIAVKALTGTAANRLIIVRTSGGVRG